MSLENLGSAKNDSMAIEWSDCVLHVCVCVWNYMLETVEVSVSMIFQALLFNLVYL